MAMMPNNTINLTTEYVEYVENEELPKNNM
jgi:hypothetical protein